MAKTATVRRYVTRIKQHKLYTIGYESCEIDEFVRGLSQRKIKIVADLRKNPVSRKPGFAKSRLAAALGNVGIEYIHMPELGVPTEWRKLAKAEVISREKMFRDYRRKILPLAVSQLSNLKSMLKKSKLALLCYEADAMDCHRSYVARKIAKKSNINDLDMLEITARVRSARGK